MNPQKGLIVKACAGREKDGFFVILDNDGKYALIADGRERKVEKPKRKSLKHLKVTNTVIELENITNKSLRKSLNDFKGTI